MTTRITHIEGQGGEVATLRVEGSLTFEEARVLENVCQDLRERHGCGVRIDLAGLSFLDQQSASLLCRLKVLAWVELAGAHLFVQQMIEQTEMNGGA